LFYWQPLAKAETIQALKKELEEANKLLKTFRQGCGSALISSGSVSGSSMLG
jgi:hypothetical protein